MTGWTEELHLEVISTCETLKGLAQTPTEDSERIASMALTFTDAVAGKP